MRCIWFPAGVPTCTSTTHQYCPHLMADCVGSASCTTRKSATSKSAIVSERFGSSRPFPEVEQPEVDAPHRCPSANRVLVGHCTMDGQSLHLLQSIARLSASAHLGRLYSTDPARSERSPGLRGTRQFSRDNRIDRLVPTKTRMEAYPDPACLRLHFWPG